MGAQQGNGSVLAALEGMQVETFLRLTLDLELAQQESCQGWASRFRELVAHFPPEIRCEMEWPEGNFRQQIVDALGGDDLATVTANVFDVILDHPRWELGVERTSVRLPKVVVFCTQDHPLAKIIVTASPHAEWGASNEMISVVYELQPAVTWHEMLHLLGAEDCYKEDNLDENAPPTCGHGNCIMQYAPTLERVGDPFFLCQDNVQRIQQRYSDAAP